MTAPDYEVFFRFAQRPFSLTPDPKFYFRSRSHGRVFDTLEAAMAGLTFAVATTARPRGIEKPVLDTPQAVAALAALRPGRAVYQIA